MKNKFLLLISLLLIGMNAYAEKTYVFHYAIGGKVCHVWVTIGNDGYVLGSQVSCTDPATKVQAGSDGSLPALNEADAKSKAIAQYKLDHKIVNVKAYDDFWTADKAAGNYPIIGYQADKVVHLVPLEGIIVQSAGLKLSAINQKLILKMPIFDLKVQGLKLLRLSSGRAIFEIRFFGYSDPILFQSIELLGKDIIIKDGKLLKLRVDAAGNLPAAGTQ